MKFVLTWCFALLTVQYGIAQQSFQWLIGTWKVKGENVFEVWQATDSPRHLEGKSFTLKGSDTIITERITIGYYNGSFHYVPDVAGDQPPVDFTVTSSDRMSFVAENPQHDFPKLIRYHYIKRAGGETIQAAIEGNGKVVPYLFEKLK
jgi:hypothetical protein